MRALKFAGAAAACLIAIVIALMVFGIPSSFITSMVQDRIERETGFKIAIAGKTRIDIWPSLSLALYDVTLDNPKPDTTSLHLAVSEVRAHIPFASLLSGSVKVSELVIDRPTLRLPMLRERTRANPSIQPENSENSQGLGAPAAFPIQRVTVSNGTIVFFDSERNLENRVDDINAGIAIGSDRKIDVSGDARPGDHPLKFTISATPPAAPLGQQSVPVKLSLDVPDLLKSQLTGHAEVRINKQVLLINGLSGMLGNGPFSGWASVNFSGKPLVKIDLDFQRLDLGPMTGKPAANLPPQSGTQPWSDAPVDLSGLNYVDAQIRISAAELNIGEARFAPAAVDASIASGILKASFSHLGTYDGEANAKLSIDASANSPAYALHGDATGIRALPLLSSLADFDSIDGKMQAKIDLHATGTSLRALMSSLNGTASLDVRDGAIRNLNIAKMIRALISGTLSGWQEQPDQTTDLSQLSASARFAQGQATINDLFLAGPLVRMTGGGSIDVASKTLALRVEPKLVMTTQGQGGSADPVGLGIPVAIKGPWREPRIYPDVSGILDDPSAAYAKLREMGQGLFGQSAKGDSGKSGNGLGETLGSMIQQGLGTAGHEGQPSPLGDIMKRLFGH